MPFDIIQTRRLVLRPIQEGDEHVINPAIKQSMPSLGQWLDWAAKAPSLADTRRHVRRKLVEWDEGTHYTFVGTLRRNEQFALTLEVWVVNPAGAGYEIGYWCHEPLQGQGLTAEAVRAISRESLRLLRARRIQIRADKKNKASQQVALRAGYQFEGCLRQSQATLKKGVLRDMMIYSRIRKP